MSVESFSDSSICTPVEYMYFDGSSEEDKVTIMVHAILEKVGGWPGNVCLLTSPGVTGSLPLCNKFIQEFIAAKPLTFHVDFLNWKNLPVELPHLKSAFKEQKCASFVILGGGSLCDLGKFLATVLKLDGGIEDFVPSSRSPHCKSRKPHQSYPKVVVPTLPGSGSHLNRTVVINHSDGFRYDIHHPALYPDFALINPLFLYSARESRLALSVFDIFCHLFEDYCQDNPLPGQKIAFLEASMRHLLHCYTSFLQSLARKGFEDCKSCKSDNNSNKPEQNKAATTTSESKCSDWRRQLFALGGLALSNKHSTGHGGFPLHVMEHHLSGFTSLSHCENLALLFNPYVKWFLKASKRESATRVGGFLNSVRAGLDLLFEHLDYGMGSDHFLNKVCRFDTTHWVERVLYFQKGKDFLWHRPILTANDLRVLGEAVNEAIINGGKIPHPQN